MTKVKDTIIKTKTKKSQNTMKKDTRKRVQIYFTEPSLTKQYFKDECDINNIIKKFTQTGQITNLNNKQPIYGEAPETDFKSALDTVKNLHREFAELSTEQRDLFEDDPEKYGLFLEDFEANPQSYDDWFDSEQAAIISKTKDNQKGDIVDNIVIDKNSKDTSKQTKS